MCQSAPDSDIDDVKDILSIPGRKKYSHHQRQ